MSEVRNNFTPGVGRLEQAAFLILVTSTIFGVTILALTMRILGIIARAIISGSLAAFMFHGWWILGMLAAGVALVIGALRVRAR